MADYLRFAAARTDDWSRGGGRASTAERIQRPHTFEPTSRGAGNHESQRMEPSLVFFSIWSGSPPRRQSIVAEHREDDDDRTALLYLPLPTATRGEPLQAHAPRAHPPQHAMSEPHTNTVDARMGHRRARRRRPNAARANANGTTHANELEPRRARGKATAVPPLWRAARATPRCSGRPSPPRCPHTSTPTNKIQHCRRRPPAAGTKSITPT